MNIESEIPFPTVIERVERVTLEVATTIDEMKIGQSVLVGLEMARCIQARLNYHGKASTRKTDRATGMVRVWRVS